MTDSRDGDRPGPAARAIMAAVGAYRKCISPLKRPCCRFSPTCSQYALDAIRRYGALKGGMMAVWRLLRCNPFGKGGYDPVK